MQNYGQNPNEFRSGLFYVAVNYGAMRFMCVAFATHFFITPKINDWRMIMYKYQEMYYILFNAITEATRILQEAQQKVEEIYISK